jgi:5-methyltetrahydrofolate--homocysteine methyltransferase
MKTVLKSATKTVTIEYGKPTILIGERINPTGKKKLAESLRLGELDKVRQEALAQVAAGADVLDLNVGTAGVDEVALLPQVVRLVMETVDVPVCLDSANPHVLRAALEEHRRIAPEGRPLINSVTGEEDRLARVLPLVAEFGAVVIGLVMDDDGIPTTAAKRLEIAHKILARAAKLHIPQEDILFDCLAMTVGADSMAATITLEAIQRVRAELGNNMTLGVSNVSFGLPEREIVTNNFVTMAIMAGVDAPIVDVAKVRTTILAADLLNGADEYAMRYIKAYKKRLKAAEAAAAAS